MSVKWEKAKKPESLIEVKEKLKDLRVLLESQRESEMEKIRNVIKQMEMHRGKDEH